jgi:soluble lytic murein transglycosylase-like protein
LVVSSDAAQAPATAEASLQGPVAPQTDPAVGPIETFLKHHGVDQGRLTRVAESIVSSAKKYNVDPRLIASIMLVESRANPFAISDKDSVGIMQIHLPTWGETTEKEGINLLKIEDNVDFGTRILKNYVRQFGLWEGVKRYKGWIPDDPASEQSAGAYLARVQTFYGSEKLGSTKTVSQ